MNNGPKINCFEDAADFVFQEIDYTKIVPTNNIILGITLVVLATNTIFLK